MDINTFYYVCFFLFKNKFSIYFSWLAERCDSVSLWSCRTVWWTSTLHLTVYQHGGRRGGKVFVFPESELMHKTSDGNRINSDVANSQLIWLISCFRCRLRTAPDTTDASWPDLKTSLYLVSWFVYLQSLTSTSTCDVATQPTQPHPQWKHTTFFFSLKIKSTFYGNRKFLNKWRSWTRNIKWLHRKIKIPNWFQKTLFTSSTFGRFQLKT